MDTKKRGRRRFLKEGAALAGMAVGAVGSASAQTPESYPPYKDRRAYGQRSRFVKTVRGDDVSSTHEFFGRTFNSASGFNRNHHAVLAPLGLDPRLRSPGYRSQSASPHDPRHGGPSFAVYPGGAKAPSLRIPDLLPRVPGKQIQSSKEDSSNFARQDRLQRMDRSAAVAVAQGGRRPGQGELDRFRRG